MILKSIQLACYLSDRLVCTRLKDFNGLNIASVIEVSNFLLVDEKEAYL